MGNIKTVKDLMKAVNEGYLGDIFPKMMDHTEFHEKMRDILYDAINELFNDGWKGFSVKVTTWNVAINGEEVFKYDRDLVEDKRCTSGWKTRGLMKNVRLVLNDEVPSDLKLGDINEFFSAKKLIEQESWNVAQVEKLTKQLKETKKCLKEIRKDIAVHLPEIINKVKGV